MNKIFCQRIDYYLKINYNLLELFFLLMCKEIKDYVYIRLEYLY